MHIHRIYIHDVDINECTELTHSCDHNCNNTEGSYTCSCRDGYLLDGDGRGCTGKRSHTYYNHTIYIRTYMTVNLLKNFLFRHK